MVNMKVYVASALVVNVIVGCLAADVRLNDQAPLCLPPDLSRFDKMSRRYYQPMNPLRCADAGDTLLAKTNGSVLQIMPGASCTLQEVFWSPNQTFSSFPVKVRGNVVLKGSDFIVGECEFKNRTQWTVLAGIRWDPDILASTGWKLLPKSALRLNVLLISFNSMTESGWARSLPLTNLLISRLGGLTFHGYNVVGSSVPSNTYALLTGAFQMQLVRRSIPILNGNEHNSFIWKQFRQNGYVTVFADDQPSESTFNRYLGGIYSQRTDHFMRPLNQIVVNSSKYCSGSQPSHQVMFDYVLNAFTAYASKPKLVMATLAELSSGSVSRMGLADRDLHSMLSTLFTRGHLNNTLVILLGNHGYKHHYRPGQLGHHLFNLPFMAMVVPPSFKNDQPQILANLRTNTNRLTTPFDVHATLLQVLGYQNFQSTRAISLFRQVPRARTCAQIGIDPGLCGCFLWKPIENVTKPTEKIALMALSQLNRLIKDRTNKCRQLTLHRIVSVTVLTISKYSRLYNMTLVIHPGSMVYRAKFTYLLPFQGVFLTSRDGEVRFKFSNWVKLNQTVSETTCLKEYPKLNDLRDVCLCRGKHYYF